VLGEDINLLKKTRRKIMTNISIQLCNRDNKFIINNMYPLYIHDLGEIRNTYPNKYGVFEEDNSIKTLEEQTPVFDIWWNKKDILFPFGML